MTIALQKQHSAMPGIVFMLLNTLCLAILDIAAKTLREDLNSTLIVFIYKFFLLLCVIPWILFSGTHYFKTKRIYFHLLRSLFGTLGAIFFINGLKYVNMASASALENVQYIIVVVLGTMIFNEKLNKTKLAAIILGFIGACIIVDPGILSNIFMDYYIDNNPSVNYLFTILAICFWSINSILVKALGHTEHNKTQIFYMLFFASIWSFPAAFIDWQPVIVGDFTLPISPQLYDPGISLITSKHILLLLLMGICYFTHGVAYFKSLQHHLSVVIPFRYTKLIFSSIFGFIFFNEMTNPYSYPGYGLVIISSFLLIRYEFRRRRKLIK